MRLRPGLALAAALALGLSGCSDGTEPQLPPPGGPTTTADPSTDPSADPDECSTVVDDLTGAFEGLDGVTSVMLEVDGHVCNGTGTYDIDLEATGPFTADQVDTLLDTFATTWESLSTADAPPPSLRVDFDNGAVFHLKRGIVAPDPDVAAALASFTQQEWRGVFNVSLDRGATVADIPPDNRRVAMWVDVADENDAALDDVVAAWEAMATALDTFGLDQGEVGIRVAGNTHYDLPVAAAAPSPDGLTEWWADWIVLLRAPDVLHAQLNPSNSGPGTYLSLTTDAPEHITLTPETQTTLDDLVARLEEMGLGPVTTVAGPRIE